jgi:hypothetical protein
MMKRRFKKSEFQLKYNKLVQKLKFRHPSYFDEFKYYQKEMFPDDMRTETELRRDYFRMAFKVEIRQNPEYSFLTYEEIDEVSRKIDLKV